MHSSFSYLKKLSPPLRARFNRFNSETSQTKVNSNYSYHIPVMIEECCNFLNVNPGMVYVDCTLGGGGHSEAILQRGGKVIGLDQDPDAIKKASDVLKKYIDRGDCEIIQTNFRSVRQAIRRSSLSKNGLVDGILMDLGVSSFQINEAGRGFAFGANGPLDMRMNKGLNADGSVSSYGFSAHDIVNKWDGNALADVFYYYGDETRARVLAREIVAARPLNSTEELQAVIRARTPFQLQPKTLARCFQALRIVVNDEMGALEDALGSMHHCLRYGGRFVVMSYHSLEDKKVKHLFRTGSVHGNSKDNEDGGSSTVVETLLRGHRMNAFSTPTIQEITTTTTTRMTKHHHDDDDSDNINPWHCVHKRAIVPSDAEVAKNSRSRSAKLRVAEQVLLYRDLENESNTVTDGRSVSILKRNKKGKCNLVSENESNNDNENSSGVDNCKIGDDDDDISNSSNNSDNSSSRRNHSRIRSYGGGGGGRSSKYNTKQMIRQKNNEVKEET